MNRPRQAVGICRDTTSMVKRFEAVRSGLEDDV